jgi:ribosomal protein S1
VGDKLRALVIVVNKVKGRITLSTKKLEKEPGDFRRLSRKEFNDRADAQADVFNAALRGVSE